MAKVELTLEDIKALILEVAEKAGMHPQEVTLRQLQAVRDDISEWKLRQFGGLSKIKKNFPYTHKDLAAIREQDELRRYVAKLERQLGDSARFEEELLETLKTSVTKIKPKILKIPKLESNGKRKMTMELMLSDIHYGKLTESFNLEVCRERMRKLTDVFIREFKDNRKLYDVERIIVALIGDIIESYTMHGLESARSCEFGNSRQVQEAIESILNDVLLPVAKLGVPIDVPCVTGNHDRTDTSKTFHNPGEEHLTWIIYNSLKALCEAHGLENVTFHIPKDSYTTLDIYGNTCLYEHGDRVSSSLKNNFEKVMNDRAKQLNTVIHFGRFGHWHEYACWDRGRIIVNESVCGQDSFAKVLGYASSPGQTINYYIETETRPTCFYKSFPVYLGD